MKRVSLILATLLLLLTGCTNTKQEETFIIHDLFKSDEVLEKEPLVIDITAEEEIVVYQNRELDVNEVIHVTDGLGNELSFTTSDIDTSELGEYTFEVIVTPPDAEAITKEVTYTVAEVPNPYLDEYGRVNFDRFFNYAFITNTYSNAAVYEAQSYIDRGYLTELVYGFYHHNTDTMLGCVHNCDAGRHVVINGVEYVSQGVQFVANLAADQSLMAWAYNGTPKIITCVQRNRTCPDRWVVCLTRA